MDLVIRTVSVPWVAGPGHWSALRSLQCVPHVYLVPKEVKRLWDPLQLKLQMVVEWLLGAGHKTQILCKIS